MMITLKMISKMTSTEHLQHSQHIFNTNINPRKKNCCIYFVGSHEILKNWKGVKKGELLASSELCLQSNQNLQGLDLQPWPAIYVTKNDLIFCCSDPILSDNHQVWITCHPKLQWFCILSQKADKRFGI